MVLDCIASRYLPFFLFVKHVIIMNERFDEIIGKYLTVTFGLCMHGRIHDFLKGGSYLYRCVWGSLY